MSYYSVRGSIRGDCGHHHQSLKTANQCLCNDRQGCSAQGGYSDRSIVFVDDSNQKVLVNIYEEKELCQTI